MPTLDVFSVSAIAKMGVNALKPFFLTIIDISMEFLTDIKDFDRQFLSTESKCLIVLILLHGNIHPVAVSPIGSICYQAHPNFIHV